MSFSDTIRIEDDVLADEQTQQELIQQVKASNRVILASCLAITFQLLRISIDLISVASRQSIILEEGKNDDNTQTDGAKKDEKAARKGKEPQSGAAEPEQKIGNRTPTLLKTEFYNNI